MKLFSEFDRPCTPSNKNKFDASNWGATGNAGVARSFSSSPCGLEKMENRKTES